MFLSKGYTMFIILKSAVSHLDCFRVAFADATSHILQCVSQPELSIMSERSSIVVQAGNRRLPCFYLKVI